MRKLMSRKLAHHLGLAAALAVLAGVMVQAPAFAVPQLPHPAASVDESSARVVRMAARNGQPQNQHITLGLNKAVVVELDTDAKDVLVSSPDIVDAVVQDTAPHLPDGNQGRPDQRFLLR